MSIKENVKTVFSDKVRFLILISTLLLTCYHIYQFFTTDNPICILRISIYVILSLIILLFNTKGMYFALIILSLVTSYFNSFVNFTQFFVLLIACRMNRKSEKWLLGVYALNESVALMLQNKDISHLIIHALTCFFFYMAYFYVNKPKKLVLLTDEEEIIKQLAEGKLQKEITLYSKNIIKEKLDHAKIRNHVIDTNELVTLYRQSHTQSHS